jgi:predicted PurR-regulated permease PerM
MHQGMGSYGFPQTLSSPGLFPLSTTSVGAHGAGFGQPQVLQLLQLLPQQLQQVQYVQQQQLQQLQQLVQFLPAQLQQLQQLIQFIPQQIQQLQQQWPTYGLGSTGQFGLGIGVQGFGGQPATQVM